MVSNNILAFFCRLIRFYFITVMRIKATIVAYGFSVEYFKNATKWHFKNIAPKTGLRVKSLTILWVVSRASFINLELLLYHHKPNLKHVHSSVYILLGLFTKQFLCNSGFCTSHGCCTTITLPLSLLTERLAHLLLLISVNLHRFYLSFLKLQTLCVLQRSYIHPANANYNLFTIRNISNLINHDSINRSTIQI